MSRSIHFTLDGREVEARAGETIWQVAQRNGTDIPHLCFSPAPGYRADGNCRACMVEIDGERVLAASCIRTPDEGMVVHSASQRAESARKSVMELLIADQPEGIEHVVVNGVPIRTEGKPVTSALDELPGRVLRSTPPGS